MISRRAVLGGLGAIALGVMGVGCKRGGDAERCESCGMKVDRQSDATRGFVAEIELPDGTVRAFDSPRCALEALGKYDGATLFVREYYEQTRVPAERVKFVEQSNVIGPMGPDFIPVDPARLTEFVAGHSGGRVSGLDELKSRFRGR